MTASYRISPKAYVKICVHAAKYPHRSVNGLLIATASPSSPQIISDVVPLFHLNLRSTSMLEVALEQVKLFCKSQSMTVVGYYHANENAADITLPPFARGIADNIADIWSGRGLALVLDATKFGSEKLDLAMLVRASACLYTCLGTTDGMTIAVHIVGWHMDSKYQHVESSVIISVATPEQLATALPKLLPVLCPCLCDFDNHLENIKLDWMKNVTIEDNIERAFE